MINFKDPQLINKIQNNQLDLFNYNLFGKPEIF